MARGGDAIKDDAEEHRLGLAPPPHAAVKHHDERLAAQARPSLPSPGAAGSACAILLCMEIIEAEFENGVLRPMRRLSLRPGERVGIVVVRRPDPARWDLRRLSKAAAADEATLAEEGLGEWADALDREDRR